MSALSRGQVGHGSPKDKEHVFHWRETLVILITPILLCVVVLLGDPLVVLLEYLALFKDMSHHALVIRAWFLQHTVKHAAPSRGASGPLVARVDHESFIEVVVLLQRVQRLMGLLDLLLLFRGVLRLAALCGHCLCALSLLVIEDCTNCFFSRCNVCGNVEQLVDTVGTALSHLVNQVPVGRAFKEGIDKLGFIDARELGAVLGEVTDEIPQGLARIPVASPEIP